MPQSSLGVQQQVSKVIEAGIPGGRRGLISHRWVGSNPTPATILKRYRPMGMFDNIVCDRIMPDGLDGSEVEFQTKDFDNEMDVITITTDGRLKRDLWHYEDTSKDKLPYPDAKPGSWQSICGIITRVVDKEDVDMNFHGTFYFYASDKDKKWHEYIAKFTDGNLVEITVAS